MSKPVSFHENNAGGLVYMTAGNIDTVHAFTTRHGGVSGGIYASLNLGLNLGDNPDHVRCNYQLLGAALGFDADRIVLSRQVHGAAVRHVTAADLQSPFDPVPEADGLITSDRNVPLFIFTADCVPILLYDPVRGAVGAVHAGWRGTVSDIAGAAVRRMADQLGCRTADIRAAIGPSISRCCYETGGDVADAVEALIGGDAGRFVIKTGDRYRVDLKGVNSFLLTRAGLCEENIIVSDDCTSCLRCTYWSHRATGGKRGSQAAVIMLKG
jgi:YfiH family protein